jgi:hypothetical protein
MTTAMKANRQRGACPRKALGGLVVVRCEVGLETYQRHPIVSASQPPVHGLVCGRMSGYIDYLPRGAPRPAPVAYMMLMRPCQTPLSRNGMISLNMMDTTVVMPPPPIPLKACRVVSELASRSCGMNNILSQQSIRPYFVPDHTKGIQYQISHTRRATLVSSRIYRSIDRKVVERTST